MCSDSACSCTLSLLNADDYMTVRFAPGVVCKAEGSDVGEEGTAGGRHAAGGSCCKGEIGYSQGAWC